MKPKEKLTKVLPKKSVKKSNTRPSIFAIVLVCAAGVCLFAIVLNVLNNRYVKNNIVFTKTKDTFYPTQYSDTHITKNATISDARFNNKSSIPHV